MSATTEAVRLKAQGLTIGQIAERQGVKTTCVRKRLRRGARDEPGRDPTRWGANPTRRRVEKDEVLPPVVNRDGCTFCGVRADIGCRHSSRGSGYLNISVSALDGRDNLPYQGSIAALQPHGDG